MKTNLFKFKSMNLICRGSGASLNFFRYAAKSGNGRGVVTVSSYGASDEHPMSIRSASDGSKWNTRGNLIGVWKYAAMLLCLLTLGAGNAWAHGGACTAKLQVNKGTGEGTVYADTTEFATSESGSSSVSADCGNSKDGLHTHTFFAFATAADGYTFLGWTESATSTVGADAENPKPVTITSNNNSTVTTTLYAHFVEKAQVNITFEAPSNGIYTIAVNGGSAETVSSADVVKNNVEGVVLTATPASGYAFAGWYKLNSAGEFVEDLSIANPYNASFTTSETLKMGARFVPVTLGKFILKGSDTQYYGLKMATVAAGGSGTIVPVADETVVDGSDLMPFDNGTYSIKAGATLLVPYSSANTVQTAPQIITTAATLSAYKTLVFTDGVNVECDGTICVGGQIMAASGGHMSSYVSGPCGMINMANGGHIELNSGAKLYCWGFIKGQDMDQGNNTVGVGTITANSGAEVWENLGIGDWRGGTATSNIKNTRFFPFQSYFIQNIEVPLTIEYGAAEKNYIALNATGGPYSTSATTIGSSQALFLLNDANSTFRKWYDPTTDLTCFELGGTSQIDELSIKINALFLSINVKSSDFDLPINSSMHIILTNSSVTLSKPMVLQPGAVIEVKNDADIILSSNAYLYDKDNWGAYAGTDYYFHSYPNLTSHKNRGNGKSNDLLDDAKVIVDGTVSVTGKLYSTASGANVMGNGGGKIVFSSSLPTATTIPAFTGNGDAVSGGVAVNSTNLCNEDESYTKAIASTTFYNVHGRWFKSGNQNENADDHTYNFTYIASGAVSGTGGTDVSPNTHNAVYAPDKTGLIAGMKWCNVEQDVTCSNIFNATQALNEIPASDIRYTYPTDSWLQLLRTETEGVYGGSDNSLYAVEGCAVNSLGSVDANCLYTINDVKKALVDGRFVALEKNTEDEAWHDVANPTNYYISFAGCTWHPATKYEGEEKAYIVEGGIYIWYNNDWLLVEREDPFFFDYNDQNVKRYYEYENGEWVLADPKVRVTDAIETREFFFLPEAITVASGKKNATITILKDISGINSRMTYSASNTTCILDLNGHTVRGAAPFGDNNNRGLLIINASGTTFTITDNSANKDGRLENICEQNKETYAVHLMAGTLNVEHGTIHAENPAQYASKVNAGLGVSAVLTGCGARGIQVNAAQTLNVTGGRIEAHATRNAYGIGASGNNANTTQVTITDGEIYAEAPCGAYGIYCSGKLNISGGLVEAKLNDHLVNASFVATDASNNINAHTTCYGIYMTGTANKAATSCYFGTLTMTGGKVKATSTVAANYNSNVYGINLYADFAGTGDANTKATDGTLSQKYAAKATIEDAEIEVNTKANNGYGIVGYGRYNSADKSTSVIKVKNTKVAVYARASAYGIQSLVRISSGTGNGGCTNGDFELTNCDVYAETTIGANAYAIWSSATQGAVYEYTYKDGVATATNSIYAGEYAIGANMTVHSGRYEAITKTSGAYASGTSTKQINTYSRHSGTALYQQLGGQVEAYSTLNIEDGTFIATAGTETARAVSNGGNTTITGGTFQATATTRYAYCIYAISGTINVSNATITATSNSNTATGIHLEGTIAANTMFAYAPTATLTNLNVTATTGTGATACALYVKGTTRTQTEAQKEALTSSNRNNYYNIYQVGEKAIAPTVTVHGGTYTATAGTSSAYGAHSSKTSVSTNKVATASPVMNLYDATFTATTGTSTMAYGVQSGGPTLIEGCTIEATAGNATTYQSTASGVRALDKTTTIKNSTITATATDKAYGLEGGVEIDGTHGYCWHGEFNLSEAGNTEVTAEAKTKAKTSYAIYLNATKKAIVSGNFAGDYATAANATINGGTYVAKFNTSGTAYVISLGAKQTQGSVVAQPEVEVLDGFFNGATAEVGTADVVGHMQLKGGYFVHPTHLATYAVAPKSVWTLPDTHEHYNPYQYKVTEHYTITFKNGTIQLQKNDLETGTTPTYSGTPTKDGNAQYTYTFDGWSTTDGGDKLAALPAVAGEATYYAHFSKTENKYTVSVAAGANGAVSPASVSGIGCETASGDITATPTTGYSFSGWTLPEGITAATGYTASSNPIHIHATATGKTITANFTAKNYTVTLNNQSATTAGQASVKATYDATMPSIASNLPAKTGYEFGGYYSATNGGGTQYYNGTGASAHVWDMDAASPTLYAKWTPKDYAITYKDQGNATFSGVHGAGAPTKHTYGTATMLVDPSKEGYTFLGWYTSQDCSTGQVTSLGATAYTDNITLFAKWKQNKFTVTWDATTNGGTAASPATTEVIPGDAVGELATTSKAGYTYKWYTAPSGGTEVTTATTVSEAKTFYAQFTPITYNIEYTLNGGSATNPTSYNVETATFTLAHPTREGYTFAGWTGSNGSTPQTGVSIAKGSTGNKSYTANWTINYTITWMDGQEVKRVEEWPEGSTPSYAYQKQETAQYTFELIGWRDENQTEYLFPATLPAVTRNATYTAQCKAITRSYTIQFVNDNNAVLQSGDLQYGATPMYNGTPVSSNDDEHIIRTFIGWSPSIVDVVGPATYKAQYRSDITAADNTTASITISEPVDNVVTTTVETTGKLEIENTGSLTTNTLILQATVSGVTSGESGEITGANHIINDVNTDVYFDLTLNTWARHWHAFGVPWPIGSLFDTKLVEIKDKQGNDCHKELTLGRDYDIIYYNGATRASEGAGRQCWDYVEDGDGTLTPGQAYMIGFIKPTGTVRFQKAAGAAITSDDPLEVTYHTGSKAKDEGWNAIANPKTYHTHMDADVTFCFVHNGDTMKSDGFTTRKMADMEFVVGTAVFVQANPEKPVVTINPYSSSAAAPRRDAVRRNGSQFYEVDIKANGKFADCIYVKADEDKEVDVYTNDLDVAKMGVSSVRAQMWVDRYDAQLAVNTVAPVNNAATYPLGIYVPQTGEYTISIGKQGDDEAMLYLTYNGRAIWNLSYADYTGSFEKGTTSLYGLRIVSTRADMPTGIDETTIENSEAVRKVIIEDKVYIIRNGKIYSITGQKAQ